MYDLGDPTTYQPPHVRRAQRLAEMDLELVPEVDERGWLYLRGSLEKLRTANVNGSLSFVACCIATRAPIQGFVPADACKQEILYDLKRNGIFSHALDYYRGAAKMAGWRGANLERKAALAACELMGAVPDDVLESSKLWPEKARKDLVKLIRVQQAPAVQQDVHQLAPIVTYDRAGAAGNAEQGARGPAEKHPWRATPQGGTFRITPVASKPTLASIQSVCSTKGKLLERKFRCHQYPDGTIEVWRER